jgi:VIT1/CCC1 family predicted Fe2+/Mn2+ transporter
MSALARWRSEKVSAWLYRVVADREEDPAKSRMFLALAEAAEEQAAILLGDAKRDGAVQDDGDPRFEPTARARIVAALTRSLGPRRTKPLLAALKVRGLSVYRSHAAEPGLDGHPMPVTVEELGERHRSAGRGGSLRAAVFGLNDGLVSNSCLILGVVGADATPSIVLTTGVAGLLAGAFSMAAGEWVSVRSQKELYERQIGEEREELARYPEEEAEELALVYEARGVPMEEARAMTRRVLQDPDKALAALAREELGLNPDDLGSPWRASIWSFAAFATGALVPLVPFLLGFKDHGVAIAGALSAFCLFVVGALLSLFSGRNAFLGGVRMLGIGAAAGAATYGIGRAVHISI